MTTITTTMARRAGLVAVAVPLMLTSSLGVLGEWPVPCGDACPGDDLQGSLLWTVVFTVALAASIAAAVVSTLGKLKIGSIALAFSAVVLGVAFVL